MLTVIEGIDNCGKTTYAKRHFNDGNHVIMSMPDRRMSVVLDRYLKKEIKLKPEIVKALFRDNRLAVGRKIRKLLSDGVNVVCDRYSYSGYVYNDDVDYEKDKLPVPDKIIYIRVVNPEILTQKEGVQELNDGDITLLKELSIKYDELFLDSKFKLADRVKVVKYHKE